MRRGRTALLAGALTLAGAGCQDFLAVNDNPNAPERVAANLYLPPMLHWMVSSPQWDGRFVGRYTQQWFFAGTSLSTWDRMGYDPGSDNGGQQWRDVYWTLGQNLVDMMTIARAEERWDILGVGYILKAWGWHVTTGLHGPIIVREAIDPSKFYFNYDSQEYAYQEVQMLLDSAIVYLQRTDDAVDATYLARGDKIYNGDRTKWLKFAYGLKAMSLNHFTNHASYDPDSVIYLLDRSFTSNADDALLKFPGTQNDDRNFYGPTRSNLTSYRQTEFVVGLMDGTQFGAVDPRMPRMLAPAPDGGYRGLDIDVVGFGALPTNQRPGTFFGRYLFTDKANFPAMTYAQLQFIRAEAEYLRGNLPQAHAAYVAGISAHIDFVNARNSDDGQTATQITPAEKSAFLSAAGVVPPLAADLTLTHIMSQKYIAQWAWGHNELWMDMRRYDYTDVDPASGRQVYPGFAPPAVLYPDNANKLVERIRPRYNSEYVWNRAALDAIGGLALDYHTVPLWITDPQ